jgi:hypothetical protein
MAPALAVVVVVGVVLEVVARASGKPRRIRKVTNILIIVVDDSCEAANAILKSWLPITATSLMLYSLLSFVGDE